MCDAFSIIFPHSAPKYSYIEMSPSPLVASVILLLVEGVMSDDDNPDAVVVWIPIAAGIGGFILFIALCVCICRLCCGCCRHDTHVVNTTVVQSAAAPPAPAVVVAPTIMTHQPDPGFTNYAYGQQYAAPSTMHQPPPHMNKEAAPYGATAPPPAYSP